MVYLMALWYLSQCLVITKTSSSGIFLLSILLLLSLREVENFSSHQYLCAMDYRPPGSSVHEISQARTLEWAAIPSPYLDLFHLLKPHGKYAQKYLIEVDLLEFSCPWILQYPSP